MKLVYSLSLSFLLFVFITNLSIAFSNDENEEILDITGEPVFAGTAYYISSSFGDDDDTYCGLQLERTSSNSNCAVTILQSKKPYEFGKAVTITNIENTSEKILTNTPLQIELTSYPNCADSSKWTVFVDNNINKACVGIGGSENYYNSKIVKGTFRILKNGNGYKFAFSTDKSSTYSDIGSYQHTGEGGKRLYLAGEDIKDPFEFVFVSPFFVTETIKSVA